MSDSTIPVVSLPHFPQVFTQALDAMVSRTYCNAPICQGTWDDNGYPCGQLVHPGFYFCPEHEAAAEEMEANRG